MRFLSSCLHRAMPIQAQSLCPSLEEGVLGQGLGGLGGSNLPAVQSGPVPGLEDPWEGGWRPTLQA